MSNSQPAVCYPRKEQYEDWKNRAEKMGYHSLSQWMIDMCEAGYKDFSINDDLRKELQQAREQIDELKGRLCEENSEINA